mmetsp:Transcript_75877/g.214562  ORF Transcript_75877/g.214562 Transcript_75877/m.214562 type:complete len:267 (-) Transcript_75877:73-873(-)
MSAAGIAGCNRSSGSCRRGGCRSGARRESRRGVGGHPRRVLAVCTATAVWFAAFQRAAHAAAAPGLPQQDDAEETEDSLRRLSLFGAPLRKCDRPAYMAAAGPGARDRRFPHTGYMRDDFCGSTTGDRGSHYVCVELPSAAADGGEVYSPFWTKTGQAPSPRDASTWPRPGPWCICMWAFARMYGHHPEFADLVDCNATNYWVAQGYDLANGNECRALGALCARCGLESPDLTHRASIRNKCALTRKVCPAAADAEKCTMHGGCEL